MNGMDESDSLNNTQQDRTLLPYNNPVPSQQHQAVPNNPSIAPPVFEVQYPHFAMIYSNQDGHIAFESSSSIADSGRTIFTPDIQERFAELVSLRPSSLANLPVSARPIRTERSRGLQAYPSMTGRTRQRGSWGPIGSPSQLIPCDWQFGHNRRPRRAGGGGRRRDIYSSMTSDYVDGAGLTLPPHPGCIIRVDDEARLKKYYEKAFEAFQQLNCRVIAKAFIKLVEPRKQVNYPYNGRRASSGSNGERRADPELTKPPWWPAGVTHKEPDHLLKAERIQLLIHILRELRESHDITAERLRDAGQDVRRSISPPERLQVLDEVYNVRHMEERYLRGEISGDVLIPIAQVHLVGPEFDSGDDTHMLDSQQQHRQQPHPQPQPQPPPSQPQLHTSEGSAPSWNLESLAAESQDGRSDAGSVEHQAVSYDHLMPERPQSRAFYANTSSTRASSFDSSMAYSPREYPSSATSSVMSHDTSPHSIDVSPQTHHSHQHHRPSFSQYLNQPMLPAAPVTTAGVLWNPGLQASAPPYQSPF